MASSKDREPSGIDAVVVGSGFGGAVTAARLAEAGMSVLVLERGPWWGPGGAQQDRSVSRPFPRGLMGMAGFLRGLTVTGERGERTWWSRPTGLFDLHLWPGVLAVAASGVGGGSLVFAGAQSRPPSGFFDRHYPDEISDAEMAPYLESAEAVQDPQMLPHPVASRPTFADGLRRAGLAGAEAPTMAIRFGDPQRPRLEAGAADAPQQTCRACGACVLGCEYGAKTSLDLSYLTLARRRGAEIRALCEVTAIGGDPGRYEVLWHDHASGADHVTVTPRLILSAGAIGTLRLLFAARDRHRSLTGLPAALGENFSGDGDYLAMLYRAAVAPHDGRHSMIQSVHNLADGSWIGEAAPPVAQLPLPAPVRRRLAETVILLSTGPEPVTRLRSVNGAPYAARYKQANAEFYRRAAARLAAVAAAYRPARFLPNFPLGGRSARLMTTHPLGGASVGRTGADGVVDHRGEVFGHRGLFIADGSTFPASPGVAPSLSIAALAERQAALMVAEGR